MQRLLISGAPFLLIDESQDTNRLLMDALLGVQAQHKLSFGLGLFGDTMQRIYADGKVDLGQSLPADWEKPEKQVNHRCPKRVIRLLNQIRAAADNHVQIPHGDAATGHVRLFIAPSSTADKQRLEDNVRRIMSTEVDDAEWKDSRTVKTLILEHHMAARRMGFIELYEPLASIDQFQTGLRDGTLPLLRFFSDLIFPAVKAFTEGNQFAAASICRKWSPLLRHDAIVGAAQQMDQVAAAKRALRELAEVCTLEKGPRFCDALWCVAKNKLFDIPDALLPFASDNRAAGDVDGRGEQGDSAVVSEVTPKVRQFLESPFAQIGPYAEYVSGNAPFGTHQGVKGLEFPRVLVIMDDDEAKGFLFSYEKLFGAKAKTKSDLENEQLGKETSIDRTRRLFYVTCSRTERSLALVAYTAEPRALRAHVVQANWFDENEIRMLQ